MFGRYRLDGLIGRGGMGEVFRAFDTDKQREVAIKRLPPRLTADPEFEARFRAESSLAARLNEPHIVPIHDYGEIDGRLYIDMRLVEGEDLASLLASGGPLPADRAVDVVAQVAAALDVAHAQDLVHRDIKPSNILAGTDAGFVYVADFGIARVMSSGSTSLTATGATVGSMEYMAPERFADGYGDHRVDVYALGCVLFEALTGRKPFDVVGLPAIINAHLNTPPPKPSELVPGLPPGLDAVVARAMAKNPDDRYPSAGALALAARAAAKGEPTPRAGSGAAVTAMTSTPNAEQAAAAPVTAMAELPRTPLAEAGAGAAAQPGVRRRGRGLLIAAVLLVVTVLAAGALVLGLSHRADAAEFRAEPVLTPGDNPFMPPAGSDRSGVAAPPRSGASFAGGTPGLYGGTLNNAACDRAQMIRFLEANPDKQAAWAQVQGIAAADVSGYIQRLTPALLRSDTAVTNHGFADGHATTVNSVLQAGTAVLVDGFGVPRARCYCGNPLSPSAGVEQPSYTGQTWGGFSPAGVTRVEPAPSPIDQFTLVDVATNQPFYRTPGTGGESDRLDTTGPVEPAPPASEAPTSAPPQPAQPQPAQPQPAPPPPPPVQPSAPDLVPTGITYNHSDLTAGTRIHFDSGVRNVGDAGTGNFNIKWLVDGREVGAYGGHDGVPARATVMDGNSQFDWTFDSPGSHRVTFVVDADSFVADSDRANNSTTTTVTIEGKPETDHAPTITGTSTYVQGALVYARINFTDEDGDAQGFGFRGVNGAGWAPEQHPFSSPSYGKVSGNRVDYPFNSTCNETPRESDVQFYIYDSGGRKSKAVTVHLSCD
jgi:hypothetical protein